VAYTIQSRHRNRLWELIGDRDPELARSAGEHGYDRLFALAYPHMTAEERELHELVRAITEHTLKPLNDSLLAWLGEDTYFKARTWGSGLHASLAADLADLEVHLLLWMAKYEVWIPGAPENALVYLADEQDHGVGFPGELQELVERALKRWWWSFGG
jgi:hypothetical protein